MHGTGIIRLGQKWRITRQQIVAGLHTFPRPERPRLFCRVIRLVYGSKGLLGATRFVASSRALPVQLARYLPRYQHK